MSEFKSQYDRQKQCAENAHCYELLYFLQQLKNEPLQKTQQFQLKRVVAYFAITDNSSRPDTDRSCFVLTHVLLKIK